MSVGAEVVRDRLDRSGEVATAAAAVLSPVAFARLERNLLLKGLPTFACFQKSGSDWPPALSRRALEQLGSDQ